MKGEKTMSEAREVYCVKCGCIESAEEMVYVESEDAYYCRDCAEANGFYQCERCGCWHHDIEMRGVHTTGDEVESWCTDCREQHAFECEHCGEFYDVRYNSSYTVDSNGWDETWCQDCRDDDVVYCYECDSLIDIEYAYRVAGDEYVCESCLNNHYGYCDDCGEYVRNEDMIYDRGHSICSDCVQYNDYWHYCENCGEWVWDSHWDFDEECCTGCAGGSRRSPNARVRAYHGDEPLMQYFGDYIGAFKGLGIELEIDRDSSSCREKQNCLNELDELLGEHAYYKHDGSLRNGIEIVTLPHTIEAFYALPWEEALAICVRNGYSSHTIGTCGLHVHLSRELFGATEEIQSDNIAKLMQFYNIYWDDILKVSRRTNDQVERWANKYPTIRKDTLKKWATKKDRYGWRYMAVNVTNEHTVEIRVNRGTLKLDSFLATIDFVVTTALNSAKIDWGDVSDDFKWLKGLKKETLDYIGSRGAFNDPVNKYLNDYWEEENARRAAEIDRLMAEARAMHDPHAIPRVTISSATIPNVQMPSDIEQIMEELSALTF